VILDDAVQAVKPVVQIRCVSVSISDMSEKLFCNQQILDGLRW